MSTPAPDGAHTPPASNAAERVFRVPLGGRIFSIVAALIMLMTTLILSAFAAIVFVPSRGLGLLIAACAGLIGALTGYCFRDLRGKLGLRIALGKDAVTLDHRPVVP